MEVESSDYTPDTQDLSAKTDEDVLQEAMEGENSDFALDTQDLSAKKDQEDTNVESDERNENDDHDTSHETIAYSIEDQNGDLVNENSIDVMNDDVSALPFKKSKLYFEDHENSNSSFTCANKSPDGAVGTSAVSAPLAPSPDSDEHRSKSPEGASNAQEPAAGTSAVSAPLQHSSHSDEHGNKSPEGASNAHKPLDEDGNNSPDPSARDDDDISPPLSPSNSVLSNSPENDTLPEYNLGENTSPQARLSGSPEYDPETQSVPLNDETQDGNALTVSNDNMLESDRDVKPNLSQN